MECKECEEEIQAYSPNELCDQCIDYNYRESKKKLAIDKTNQIIAISNHLKGLFETATDNVYAVNNLNKIISKAGEQIELIKSII